MASGVHGARGLSAAVRGAGSKRGCYSGEAVAEITKTRKVLKSVFIGFQVLNLILPDNSTN